MFGISRSSAKEFADVDIDRAAARRGIRLVPDEHISRGRIATEEPPIPVRAAIKLPGFDSHPIAPTITAQRMLVNRRRARSVAIDAPAASHLEGALPSILEPPSAA
jgi:hypothetical protein